MAEFSLPWPNGGVGDDQAYSDDDWSDMWNTLFCLDRTKQGVIRFYESLLAATAAAGDVSPVTVASGGALVDGKFYTNGADVDFVIDTPTISTRVDRIVLRKSWAAHEVRLTLIDGVEGAGTPAITQNDGITWDVPLWQVSITTGGIITVIDERRWLQTPMASMNKLCCGRLTLTSLTPVTVADVTAATTIYFTPYQGNAVTLWDGSQWVDVLLTECSVAVPATTETPFDIFAYIDAYGQVAIETLDWASDTTRATAIVNYGGYGIYTKSGDSTRRYLGTGRTTTSSGETEDSEDRRYLWNYYNRVHRYFKVSDATGHAYATGTWRAWNNDTSIGSTRAAFVVGVVEGHIFGCVQDGRSGLDANTLRVGLALNATNTNHLATYITTQNIQMDATPGYLYGLNVSGYLTPIAGFNYLQAVEYGAATSATVDIVAVIGHVMG